MESKTNHFCALIKKAGQNYYKSNVDRLVLVVCVHGCYNQYFNREVETMYSLCLAFLVDCEFTELFSTSSKRKETLALAAACSELSWCWVQSHLFAESAESGCQNAPS